MSTAVGAWGLATRASEAPSEGEGWREEETKEGQGRCASKVHEEKAHRHSIYSLISHSVALAQGQGKMARLAAMGRPSWAKSKSREEKHGITWHEGKSKVKKRNVRTNDCENHQSVAALRHLVSVTVQYSKYVCMYSTFITCLVCIVQPPIRINIATALLPFSPRHVVSDRNHTIREGRKVPVPMGGKGKKKM